MKRTIITCCAFLCYVTLAAQPASTDSLLMRYRQMALEYNDDLKAAVRNIEASMELERAARADRTPTLSAGADFKYTGNPLELSAELPGVGPLTFEGQDLNYGASVTLLQPVYTGGRIIEAIRLAESQTLVAEAEQELLHSSVCYQVDVQYWTAVARYELMTVADEFLRSVTDLERIVRERVEAGAADRQELLTVEVKRNEAEYRCLQAENDFKVGLMALNSLVGLPLDNATPVGEQVAAVDGAAVADNSLLRPELRIAEERIGMARSSMRLNDAQYKPQLYVGANGGFYATFRPTIRFMPRSPFRFSTAANDAAKNGPILTASIWRPTFFKRSGSPSNSKPPQRALRLPRPNGVSHWRTRRFRKPRRTNAGPRRNTRRARFRSPMLSTHRYTARRHKRTMSRPKQPYSSIGLNCSKR